MHDLLAGDHGGSTSTDSDAARRFLESTGYLIEGPEGPVASLGPHTTAPSKRTIDDVAGGTVWWLTRPQYLFWHPRAARAILGGVLVTDLLGTSYLLLDGRHRPAWHPCPGVDAPVIAYLPWPPAISSVELMVKLASQLLG